MDNVIDWFKIDEFNLDLLIQFFNAGAGWKLYPLDRPVGALPGPTIAPVLPDISWEFWERV